MLFQNHTRHDRWLRYRALLCFTCFCCNIFTYSARATARIYRFLVKILKQALPIYDPNTYNMDQATHPSPSEGSLLASPPFSFVSGVLVHLSTNPAQSTLLDLGPASPSNLDLGQSSSHFPWQWPWFLLFNMPVLTWMRYRNNAVKNA